MLHSNIGELVRVDGVETLRTRKGEAGLVLYGPYSMLAPGSYLVEFHITAEWAGLYPCCVVDVLVGGKDIVTERRLSASDLAGAGGVATLAFTVEQQDVYEFRVHSTGQVGLLVRRDRPLRLMSSLPAEAAAILSWTGEAPALFKAHYASFASHAKHGFRFAVRDGVIVASYADVLFTIESPEDFAAADEVFLANAYNVLTRRDAVAVDIGMHVGLGSLYFARMPHVKRVYGFEPFVAPFRRASRNFRLNPGLRDKITESQLGLSDRNETLSVLSEPNERIGNSLRGAVQGVNEEIAIRDAAEILGPVIEDARRSHAEVILKVDCEGSEFAVFQSLRGAGLLPRISALACAWHKWWDPAKSQFDIIDPLIAAGFAVIDRTNPTNPHTGFFYAIAPGRPS